MNPLNLDMKYKGQTGAKPTKEYLDDIESKINEIIGWNIPKEFLNTDKMTEIKNNTDANEIKESGIYFSTVSNSNGTIANFPKKSCSMIMFAIKVATIVIVQIVVPSDGTAIYIRRYFSNDWQSWYRYSGTAVTF